MMTMERRRNSRGCSGSSSSTRVLGAAWSLSSSRAAVPMQVGRLNPDDGSVEANCQIPGGKYEWREATDEAISDVDRPNCKGASECRVSLLLENLVTLVMRCQLQT